MIQSDKSHLEVGNKQLHTTTCTMCYHSKITVLKQWPVQYYDHNPINKTNYKITMNNIKMIETMYNHFLRNTNLTLKIKHIAKNIVKSKP